MASGQYSTDYIDQFGDQFTAFEEGGYKYIHVPASDLFLVWNDYDEAWDEVDLATENKMKGILESMESDSGISDPGAGAPPDPEPAPKPKSQKVQKSQSQGDKNKPFPWLFVISVVGVFGLIILVARWMGGKSATA